MGYLPMNYDKVNFVAGTYTPSEVMSYNNDSFRYWERSLFQRAMSVIEIENLPEEWRGNVKDFLFWCLFKYGYVATFKNNRFGISFQPCSLNGYDFYYQPTDAIICNPKLDVTLQIHTECEILKICPDYMGIWDVINRYAARLSSFDPAIDMAIVNSKYATIMGASTKAGVKFLEKVVDKINEGQPAVIVDTSIVVPTDPVTKEDCIKDYSRNDIKKTYIGTELLQDFETVLHEFDTEIGIPTIPNEKKERMITDEANSKVVDATSRSLVWVDTMNECFNLINKLLGTSMRAVHNYADMIENMSNESEVASDE